MTVKLAKACTSCGAEVTVDAPEEGIGAAMAARLGVICDECDKKLAAEEAERERQVKVAHYESALAKSGIPSIFARLKWDDMDFDEPGRGRITQAARAWSQGEGKQGLFIFGPVGTGKTRLAAIAARHRLWREPLLWMSVPVMIAKSTAEFGSKEKRQVGEALTGTRALVLDDIDKVRPNDWVLAQLFAAIDGRLAAGAPLLITGNLGPEEMADRFRGEFGEAIVSRIVEHCALLHLKGRDRRRDQ